MKFAHQYIYISVFIYRFLQSGLQLKVPTCTKPILIVAAYRARRGFSNFSSSLGPGAVSMGKQWRHGELRRNPAEYLRVKSFSFNSCPQWGPNPRHSECGTSSFSHYTTTRRVFLRQFTVPPLQILGFQKKIKLELLVIIFPPTLFSYHVLF